MHSYVKRDVPPAMAMVIVLTSIIGTGILICLICELFMCPWVDRALDWCFARNEGPPTNASQWGLNDVRRIQTGSMVEIVPLAPRRHWWCRRQPIEQPGTTKATAKTNTKPRTMTRREVSYHGDFATLPAPPARSYQSPAHRYKGEGTLIFDADAYNKV